MFKQLTQQQGLKIGVSRDNRPCKTLLSLLQLPHLRRVIVANAEIRELRVESLHPKQWRKWRDSTSANFLHIWDLGNQCMQFLQCALRPPQVLDARTLFKCYPSYSTSVLSFLHLLSENKLLPVCSSVVIHSVLIYFYFYFICLKIICNGTDRVWCKARSGGQM